MASFYDAYFKPVVDAQGNPVLDEYGIPKAVPAPRRWDVEITYGVAIQLKARHKIDLMSDTQAISQILQDPVAVLQVIDVACEKQLRERGMQIEDLPYVIDDMELASRMDAAVTEAIIDFFPPRLRSAMKESYRKVTEAARKKGEQLTQQAEELLSSPGFQTRMELELDRQMESALKGLQHISSETSGTSAGNSPEPAASSCSI